jgi:hypothetical protein
MCAKGHGVSELNIKNPVNVKHIVIKFVESFSYIYLTFTERKQEWKSINILFLPTCSIPQ